MAKTRTLRLTPVEAQAVDDAISILGVALIGGPANPDAEVIVAGLRMISAKWRLAENPIPRGRPLIDVLAEDENDVAYFQRKAAMEEPDEQTEPDYV